MLEPTNPNSWTTIIDEQNQPIEEPATASLKTQHSALRTEEIRNRIKCHKKVRAADLVPHEWNFRIHPGNQRTALEALYRQVGFARSLLAYELPDGRLKLIDGHLRRDIDPDMEVDVEILDVNEDEARALLLSIDPLAALARTQEQIHQRLMEVTPVAAPELEAAWQASVQAALAAPLKDDRPGYKSYPEQFLILVTCRDEKHQGELLTRCRAEGWECKAVVA